MPKPTAWLAPPPDWRWNYELGSLRDANCDECYLFGGAGMLALFCCCFLPIFLRRGAAKKLSASFGISALVAAAMVTDFGDGISPWYFARFLPGGMTIRAVGRVYIVVYLFILLGGISGLRMVLRQYVKKTSIRFFLMTLAGALIVFEQTGFTPPSFEAAKFYDRIGPVAERLLGADAGFVETSEFAGLQGKIRWDIQGHLLPMWAGLQANVPVVNGYSGRYPVEYPYKQWWSEDDFRSWLGPDFRGRLVIVNPDSLRVRELHLP